MKVERAAALLLLALLAAPPALAETTGSAPTKKILKWTDENGKVHYGESIPPEYQDRARTEMNTSGVEKRKFDASQTPEQRRAAEEKASAERDDRAKRAEQQRRDVALLQTYTNVKDIDESRDRSLSIPQQALLGLAVRMKRAQERMAGLQKEVDTVTRLKKPIPEALKEEVADQNGEIAQLKQERARFDDQIEKIRAKHDADRKRYLELTAPR